MTTLKSLFSHKWNTQLYENVVSVVKDGKKPVTRIVARRSKIYSYDPLTKRLVYEYKGVLPWNKKHNFSIIEQETEHVFQVIKPEEKQEIMKQLIADISTRSLGIYSAYAKVLRLKYLNISRSDIKEYFKTAEVIRMSRIKHVQPIKQSYLPKYSFQQWQIDLMDLQDFSKYNKKYSWVLVIVDIFSKYTYAFPLYQKSGKEIKASLEYLFFSGDIPERIQHDNEKTFQSNDVKELFQSMNIVQIINDSYSPQTNGFVENKIKFIKRMIDSYFQEYRTFQWITILSRVIYNVNNTKHSVTGFTPYEIHRGRTQTIGTPVLLTNTDSDSEHKELAKDQLRQRKARELYIQKTIEQTKMKEQQKKKTEQFQIGDKVYVPYELKDSSGIKTFILRRTFQGKPYNYSSDQTLTLRKFGKKLKFRYYPDVFQIIQKSQNTQRGRFYFTLKDVNKEGTISYVVKQDETKISEQFYPEQLFYISEPVKEKEQFLYTDPVLKEVKLQQPNQPLFYDIFTALTKCPKTKWTNLQIKKAWNTDEGLEWYTGTIKKYTPRETFKFDIKYPNFPVQKENLLPKYYSRSPQVGNWFFTQEETFLNRCKK